MTHQSLGRRSAFPTYLDPHASSRRAAVGPHLGKELALKLLIVAVFLPEGLSFFVGDFRFSPARALLIVLSIAVPAQLFRRVNTGSVFVPSDVFALVAGIWMILAAVVTGGVASGFKGGAAGALEFTGAYYVFRYFLGPVDSCVRVIKFCSKLIVVVVIVALLDPWTGKLFTYELVKGLTGYVKIAYENALAAHSKSIYRNGLVRAMGPLEHSILFGCICVWFGTLALLSFPSRLFGWGVGSIALVGVWFSQSRGPLLGYVIACALAILYVATKQFTARWKVLGLLVASGVIFIFVFSGSPVSTLMRIGGISPEASWYRQAIWNAALPLVANSPVFGIGLTDEWDWQTNGALIGTTVDAFWLRAAMMFGIPGSVLIFLTMVGAFWLGPVDRSRQLSREERFLSVALGIVVAIAIFLGFTVHFWGSCWIVLGVFSGMRANLAECAILRQRVAIRTSLNCQIGHWAGGTTDQQFSRMSHESYYRAAGDD